MANLLLVDWLHLVLPAGLQLWRSHWLAHLLANAMVGALLYRDIRNADGVKALCLSLLFLLVKAGMPWWVWGLFALLYALWPRLLKSTTPTVARLLGALFTCGMLVILAMYAAGEWLPFRLAHYRLDLYAFDRRMLAFPLLALGLPLAGVLLWNQQASRGRWVLVAALGILLTVGACRWDARSPIAQAVENNSNRPDLFGPTLPVNAQVFWVGDLYAAPWIALHRADYFSTRQLAGAVFNQGSAIEGRARLERVRPVIEEDMYCQDRSVPLQEREYCRISDASLRQACAAGPTRPPDYLILPYRQTLQASGSWTILDPMTGGPAITYWLYACPRILEGLRIQH